MIIGLGMLFQAFAVFIMAMNWSRLGRARLGPLFLALMIMYHGVPEWIALLFPPRSTADILNSSWFLIASVAIALFSSTYVALARRLPVAPGTEGIGSLELAWRHFVLLFGILFVWSVLGSAQESNASGYWQSGLSGQLLLPTLVLATTLFARRFGRIGFVTGISLQTVLLALLGQRTQVAIAAVVVVLLLYWLRVGIRIRDIAFAAIVAMVAFLAISSARSIVGREILVNGPTPERIESLVSGVRQPLSPEVLAEEVTFRLNGNYFAGLILDRLEVVDPLGLEPLRVAFSLSIPAAVWPDKYQLPEYLRNEEALVINRLNLVDIDHRSSLLAIALTYGGPILLILLSACTGLGFAFMDRRLGERPSGSRLILYACLAIGVLNYESGMISWLIGLRSGLILVALMASVGWIRAAAVRSRGADSRSRTRVPAS